MTLALLMMIAAPAAAGAPAAIDFDLAKVKRPSPFGCPPSDGTRIVVCGRRGGGEAYPLEAMARIFEPKPLRTRTRVAGGEAAAYVEQGPTDRGAVSKRAMVGWRLPF